MSDVDLNKLKVVELRAELTQRGLDTKGTKSVLIERLKTAMDREKGLPDGGNEEDGHTETTAEESKQDTSQEENHEESATQNEEEMEVKPPEPKESEAMDCQEESQAEEETKQENGSPVKEPSVDKGAEATPETKEAAKEPSPPRHYHYSRSSTPSKRSEAREPSPDDTFDDNLAGLDLYHSDLNLILEKTRWRAEPLSEGGFAYMWGGAKANYGVTSGKVAFEVQILKLVDLPAMSDKEKQKHGFRIGYSTDAASLQLGEDKHSYGYTDSAKSCTKSEFKNYGDPYKDGDIVTALLNMESDPIEIGFAKNGTFQGIAFTIPKEELENQPLYPHVLSKNIDFKINFGQEKEEPFNKLPDKFEDYTMIGDLPLESRTRALKGPQKREECEILMMCGLPAAGKTTWALNHMKENPDKKYVLLGKHLVLEKMKVDGKSRKSLLQGGAWRSFVEKASLCLDKLFSMAERQLRNYILDQTNTFEHAQRRKMKPFEGFKRTAVVVVPSDEEYKKRKEKQKMEENNVVQDSAVQEMKVKFSLPSKSQGVFDEIIYTELQKDEATDLVNLYNNEMPRKRSYHHHNDDGMHRGGGRPYYKRFRGNSYGGHGDYGGYYSKERRGPPNYHYYDNRTRGGGGFQNYRSQRNYGNYEEPSPWRQGGYGGGGGNWNQRGGGGYSRGGYSRGGGSYYGGYNR